MVSENLEGLKNHILGYHNYFSNAYSDVTKGINGIVRKGETVFPSDNLGDYFYLRASESSQALYNSDYNTSSCIQGFGISTEVVLVACVRNADPDLLLENLVNSIREYPRDSIKFMKFVHQSEYVVLQELKGIGGDALNAALQRLRPDFTMVSVSFAYSSPMLFKKLNCYEKPCKQC